MQKLITKLPEPEGVLITQKDIEVVLRLSNGLKNEQIAKELELSRRTVEGKLNNLRSKTGCRTLAELVATFFRNGLIS